MEKCNDCGHEKIREKLVQSDEYLREVEWISNVFSLLGEANRMKIVLALLEGELCVYHICEITNAKQSVTSQHLKKLKDGNVLKSRKLGNQVLYSIKDEHVVSIIKTALLHKNCID